MASLTLNLVSAATYLFAIDLLRLDGLWKLIVAKMAELGVEPSWRATRRVKPDLGTERPTGSLLALNNWVRSLDADATEQDRADLQTLHAVIKQRFDQAGYVPKEEPPEDQPED